MLRRLWRWLVGDPPPNPRDEALFEAIRGMTTLAASMIEVQQGFLKQFEAPTQPEGWTVRPIDEWQAEMEREKLHKTRFILNGDEIVDNY